jgi:hypothetical protein
MRRIVLIVAIIVVITASFVGIRHVMASGGTAVSGEVVETYCWGALSIGGPGHAKCGIECAKRGIPVALYDARSRKAFVLLPGRDKTSLSPELIAAMGRKVTVRGDVLSRGGMSFMTVHSWELQ